ncbi:Crp/Fnr family transcriptional regulator [Burkholderia oklahomensis]|uniref:Crp/Fnr family transcriptional regulator n=1 Tax=Burkholderia oklahomensis TaxID=342113 RepID=UPI00016A9E25|nr:Crp/Fnr family transcriptional regulator [Burkholderia oklahomensis]AJX31104.1 cyclic nucleotide-binding domain protein [Burkholderia oklahomensis C6786]AOI46890.1 Crp/Fnr family transcriptional regulator [Burkholderia oklahomensis C6786]KUY58455.1 Crp/Fnr family transcriptional regulator [Burkholderia oklahomensis C6786]MBI0360445.1 Crp/Fnr family transcriptional regulator [Burkholderia oklahomensis]SUW59825.1 cAMP regulatory protein [Burkholderia oklahomensis]
MHPLFEPYRSQLDAHPWFGALPAELRDALVAAAAPRRLAAGQVLFRRGDAPCGLYAVLSGALSVGAVDASGKEALLTVAEPTTWFGEIALFDELPRTHDAIALEDALLMHVPQAALQQLLDETPRYWRHFALLMAQKLRMSFMNVEALTLMPAPQRLASRLLMIADGYGGISARHRRIKLSQERLGAMLSLSRQTANQLLKDLAARGVVKLHVGEIEIVDLNALRTASGAADGRAADRAESGARGSGDAHGADDVAHGGGRGKCDARASGDADATGDAGGADASRASRRRP